MTKTLADMTPEQRANCIGMWCEYPNIYDRLGIIYALDDENDPWILRFDVRTEILGYDAKNIIPRFDLPRAWTPDGSRFQASGRTVMWLFPTMIQTPGFSRTR
ncbi:hypothetical protein AZH46_07000 [Corynebacterium striatum]|nr:hypothetical protein AZH46_07000 [Corynebacterium striatum]